MVSRFVCPITLKEMNGKLKFVYLNTCGCVFSEQGLKEVPSSTCIQVRLITNDIFCLDILFVNSILADLF
jgi:hypothetical protein